MHDILAAKHITNCIVPALIPASKYLEHGVGQVLVKALVWACINTPNLVPQPTFQHLEAYQVQLGGSSNTNLLATHEQLMMHPSLLNISNVEFIKQLHSIE